MLKLVFLGALALLALAAAVLSRQRQRWAGYATQDVWC